MGNSIYCRVHFEWAKCQNVERLLLSREVTTIDFLNLNFMINHCKRKIILSEMVYLIYFIAYISIKGIL